METFAEYKSNTEEKPDKLYCLVGPSGTGKTTVAKKLWEDGHNVIQSFTTRPRREAAEWGHIFLNIPPECVDDYISAQRYTPISRTVYDGHMYFAVTEQIHGDTVFVVDLPGVEEILKNLKRSDVVIINLIADCGIRGYRMKEQGRSTEDIIGRVEYDSKVFRIVRADWVVDTTDLDEDDVARLVKGIIRMGG